MRGDQLLEAIYASPDDDAPRAVYADWLQERGDVLGELIALQLASQHGSATRAALRRETALIMKHRKAWLGELWEVVRHTYVGFERGFVADVGLRPRIPPKRLAAAIGDRRWTTVRRLDMGGFEHADLLLHDVLRGVRVLGSVAWELAAALLVDLRARRVRELDLLAEADTLAPPDRDALAAAVGLPELRHLRVRVQRDRGPAALDWLWSSPLGARLESLTFTNVVAISAEWHTSDALPRNLSCLRFHSLTAGPLDIATLRRGPSGRLDQLEEPLR